jgi:hypothetical protein
MELCAYGLPALLQLAGKLITDNTQEAREAAKRLVFMIKIAFVDGGVEAELDTKQPPPALVDTRTDPLAPPTQWETFCNGNLTPLAAAAVLKVE